MNDASNAGIILATAFDWMLNKKGIERILKPYVTWRLNPTCNNCSLELWDCEVNEISNDGRGIIDTMFNMKIMSADNDVAYCRYTATSNSLIIDSLSILDYSYILSILNAIEDYADMWAYESITIRRSSNLPIDDVFIKKGYECNVNIEHTINYISSRASNVIVVPRNQAIQLARNTSHPNMSDEEYIETMLSFNGSKKGFYRQYDCGYKEWHKSI